MRTMKGKRKSGGFFARASVAVLAGGIALWAALPMLFGICNIGNLSVVLIFGLLALGALCWPSVARLFRRVRAHTAGKWCLRALVVLVALGVGYCAAASVMMVVADHNRAPGERALPAIVLGCQVYSDGPSPMLEARLQTALAYLEHTPGAVCILSGGRGDDEHQSEGRAMYDWMAAHGIDQSRLYIEEASANTEQNLAFSLALMRQNGLGDEAVVVTDNWHALRAQVWARRAGLTAYSESCATRPDLWLTFYARELFALARLFFLGH